MLLKMREKTREKGGWRERYVQRKVGEKGKEKKYIEYKENREK
jgi:hypothetical protein